MTFFHVKQSNFKNKKWLLSYTKKCVKKLKEQTFAINPKQMKFFNPKVEEYITIYSDPIYIDVEGVNKNSSSDNDSNELNTTNKKN